ncbi:hypothetical protein C6569_21505 [Phreatobacter cathodiphilus]|uniref:Histidine phosphatase family protein n=1 Tax=Phreatobacter cathodiphilus TaxID=1868589 RepID=A0A2S0NGW1_9HYPH|nr:hypothetical protein C6569_21505 [Phreatobacter cathodiphilus]
MRLIARVAASAALALAVFSSPGAGRELMPLDLTAPAAQPLVDRLRQGGLVLFFRHADTAGMACDSSFRVGDRAGQRNISERGREQSRRIGAALRKQGIPVARPVLAGPVFRARDTAEEAFGAAAVEVVDGLTADDFAGSRLDWVLAQHRLLVREPVPAGTNRVLVGHRTPAIMIFGETVGGRAFPEGAAIVIDPAPAPHVLGIIMPAPIAGAGFHGC